MNLHRHVARLLVAAGLAVAIAGCGSHGSELPHTKSGSFMMIEGGVNDIVSTISDPNYKPRSMDLGTDSDRIGLALVTFLKETEGSGLAEGAAAIKKKFEELEKLTATRAPVEKQRAAARELQEAVAAVKAKL